MRRMGLLIGLLAVLAGAAQAATPPGGASPVVRTADGPLRGHRVGAVAGFKGVPFAAPPVGPLRWREPAPVARWTAVRDASAFAPACAQAAFDWNRAVAEQSREDCLYLNLWVPARVGRGPLPVLIFFPGGANHGGSAMGSTAIEPSYDGAKLAARGVIVVTANYRLGVLGFLAHPELTAESPHHASGNYALMDQLAALRWVQANITRFGGDPAKVTAMGQSSGAFDLSVLMTSPQAKGLFARAILISTAVFNPTMALEPAKTEEAFGVALAKGLGAPDTGAIAALRQIPAAALTRAFEAGQPLAGKEPHVSVDGSVVTEQPTMAFAEGREAPIPMLIGTTAREGDRASMGVKGTPKADAARADLARTLVGAHTVAPATPPQLAAVRAYFAPDTALAEAAVRFYADPAGTDPSDGDVGTAFGTDRYRCNSMILARWHARRAATWSYQFSHGYEPLGAVHLWDLQYLFADLTAPADQPRDRALSRQLQLYLTAFARTAIPVAPGQPAWPRFGADAAYLDFSSDGAVVRTHLRAQACALFQRKMDDNLVTLRQDGANRPAI